MPAPEHLHGLPSDYEVLGGSVPRNRNTGETGLSNNPNGYTFMGQVYRLVGGKLVPQFPLPGGNDTAAEARGYARAVAEMSAFLARAKA